MNRILELKDSKQTIEESKRQIKERLSQKEKEASSYCFFIRNNTRYYGIPKEGDIRC